MCVYVCVCMCVCVRACVSNASAHCITPLPKRRDTHSTYVCVFVCVCQYVSAVCVCVSVISLHAA